MHACQVVLVRDAISIAIAWYLDASKCRNFRTREGIVIEANVT